MIIMLHVKIIILHINISMLHFDINKSYVNIVMLHDDTNYLRGGGQNYQQNIDNTFEGSCNSCWYNNDKIKHHFVYSFLISYNADFSGCYPTNSFRYLIVIATIKGARLTVKVWANIINLVSGKPAYQSLDSTHDQFAHKTT